MSIANRNSKEVPLVAKVLAGLVPGPWTAQGKVSGQKIPAASGSFPLGLQLRVPSKVVGSNGKEVKIGYAITKPDDPSLSVSTRILTPLNDGTNRVMTDFKISSVTGNVVKQTLSSGVTVDYQYGDEQSFSHYGNGGSITLNFASNEVVSAHSGNVYILTGASGVVTGVSAAAQSVSGLLGGLVEYKKISYPANTGALKVIPNNWYNNCLKNFDGILTISTGSGASERIIYATDSNIVNITSTTGVYGLTGFASSGTVRLSGFVNVPVVYKVITNNDAQALPSGLTINYNNSGLFEGFNEYLQQSTPLKDSNFYQLYSGMFNINTGTWTGLIPANTPYSIACYNTGIVYNNYFTGGTINLSVFSDRVLTSTGVNFAAQKLTASGIVDIKYYTGVSLSSGSYATGNNKSSNDFFIKIAAQNSTLNNIALQKHQYINSL
jgi:hypothetical protein